MRRPRSDIPVVIIHQKDSKDEWVPRRFEKNSWIALTAPKRGKWARKGDFKAIIKGFKFKPNSHVVESILVAHAYSFKELQLEKMPPDHINYLYPSGWEDWEDPTCISNIIVVMHAEYGEVIRGNRTHKELLDAGIYFYNAAYDPPSKEGRFGRLVPLSLPPLDDPEWPLPDMNTTESFRHHLFLDFQNAMKPKTGARVCNIHWYMPMHVMVDLFNVQCKSRMHRTSTLFVFRPVSELLFASLMDKGWDMKIQAQNDVIRCCVIRESVIFRYHMGRSTLYTTFKYHRSRLVGEEWIDMDQIEKIEMRSIEVDLLDKTTRSFEVGCSWSLIHLREELGFYLSSDLNNGWSFQIVDVNGVAIRKKINRRQEKKFQMSEIGDENHLRLIPCKS